MVRLSKIGTNQPEDNKAWIMSQFKNISCWKLFEAYLAVSGQDRQRLSTMKERQSLNKEMRGARKWGQLEPRELAAMKMKRHKQIKMKKF